MKRWLILGGVALATIAAHAQPPDMLQHQNWVGLSGAYWWGSGGLDPLGRLSDTIPHALAIGELYGPAGNSYASNGCRSNLVFNNAIGDTARQFEFPGQKVFRCNWNGDAWPDYVVWCYDAHKITILLGTPRVDSFITGFVLQKAAPEFEGLQRGIIVTDCDSDGYDDLVVSDGSYDGRILFYRGGPKLDSLPSAILPGTPNDHVGGALTVGSITGRNRRSLLERRYSSPLTILVYPFGPGFRLVPKDTIRIALDTSRECCFQNDFKAIDVDADGIDDIVTTLVELRGSLYGRSVVVYKGGTSISSVPLIVFHNRLDLGGSDSFGWTILDAGNFTGHGYHSLIVTQPQAGGDIADYGAIFVYNIGKALNDSCVAYAEGLLGFGDYFGTQIAAMPDMNGDSIPEIIVGAVGGPHDAHGYVAILYGSPDYGPTVGVRESATEPHTIALRQNFPNPATDGTWIPFVTDGSVPVVTLSVYDMLGRRVAVLYHGPSENAGRTVYLNTRSLPAGEYLYRLSCGSREVTRLLNVVH